MLDSTLASSEGLDLATWKLDLAIYKRLIDTVSDYAIYILDPDGIVQTWNAGAQRAKQFTAAEVIGRHFSLFYTEEDQAANLPKLALEEARNAGLYEVTGWRVRKDGSRMWADVVIEPLRDPAGALLGFTKIVRDCTDRHRDHVDTMEREKRFRYLVQGVTDSAVYMLDLHGVVLNWNAGARMLKGYAAEEVVGQHFACFYTAEDGVEGAPAKALAIARTEGRFETEAWRVRKDGTRFWAQVVIELINDDDGRPIGFAKITKDRTEQRQAHAEILASEKRFRHLVQGVRDYAIYMLDPEGMVTNWNAGAVRTTGYTSDEIVGQHFSRFFTVEDQTQGQPRIALEAALREGHLECEGWRVRKNGERFWAHVILDLLRDEDGALIGYAKITRDITRQKEDADRITNVTRTLDLALSNMKHGLCVFGAAGALQLANRRFVEMFDAMQGVPLIGMSFLEVIRLLMRGHIPAEEATGADLFHAKHRQLIDSGGRDAVVETLPGGISVAISHSALADGSWVSTFEDVTERRLAEETIATLASQDSLTGLANRRTFHAGITSMLEGANHVRPAAAMLIDLDNFKAINDTYGHGYGDRVLQHVADSMRTCLRAGDLAARLGGDEFAVILWDCPAQEAVRVAERMIASIRTDIRFEGETMISAGVSIGIVIATLDYSDPDTILHHADLALYEAKADGKGSFKVYTQEMSARMRAQFSLEEDLREAVAALKTGDCAFALHYQPLLNVGEDRIVGREGLLRWTHSRRGPVPPSVFIPVAERIGAIEELEDWALHRACTDAAEWPDGARVALNVSAKQLGGGTFVSRLGVALGSSGLPPERLEIDITESALACEGSAKLVELHAVRALGVSVTLDDFGVGPSSLNLLRAFPFDRIKLDGTFVQDAIEREASAAIVGLVVALGRSLGITVVAEGVETAEQLEFVRSEGCQEVQGFLIGRATAASMFSGKNEHHPIGEVADRMML